MSFLPARVLPPEQGLQEAHRLTWRKLRLCATATGGGHLLVIGRSTFAVK